MLIGGAILTLALASCATANAKGGGPDPGLRGEWQLQNGTDADGTIPLGNQLISLTIDGDDTTTGRSTCSNYTAHVYGTVSTLWVTATLPKVEACGIRAQFDIERRYIRDLNLVRTSTLAGGVLHLLAPGVDLQFHRALTVPLGLVVDREWKLASIASDSYYATANPTPVSETGARIRFSRAGTLAGQTLCTTFSAHYTQNAGEIVISDLQKKARFQTGEREGCIGQSQTADDHLFDVLTTGFTFLSGGGTLTITSPRAELTLGFVS
jgi:heat shock protein HslJ